MRVAKIFVKQCKPPDHSLYGHGLPYNDDFHCVRSDFGCGAQRFLDASTELGNSEWLRYYIVHARLQSNFDLL